MATRPIFVPDPDHYPYVRTINLDFQWYAGFAATQVQKSIASLHASAATQQLAPTLEISSKSPTHLGVLLSAFNLALQHNGREMSVECAFQGSKVFEKGGPYHDLYTVPSRAAKQDPRIWDSGRMIGFRFFDQEMPTQPITAFYDWLYLSALVQHPESASKLCEYKSFSDIAFNPEKSWNCQARSAALFVALSKRCDVSSLVGNLTEYLDIISKPQKNKSSDKNAKVGQKTLFDESEDNSLQ